jgi:SAM-dependent methyltransferase
VSVAPKLPVVSGRIGSTAAVYPSLQFNRDWNVSTSADFIDAFSDAAERYASARPVYPRTLFQTFATLAPATLSAWDCGTGSGQAAVGLAEFFDGIDATDASAEQIAQAQSHPRVQYRAVPAESSGLSDKSVDLISVATALHWFDRDRFFSEVRRVARPSALLAVYGYSWFYLTPTIDELINRWLLQPVESYWSANNRLLWDGYRTIAFPFEELTAPCLAIHLTWTLDQLLDYYLTWSAPRRKIAAEGSSYVGEARRVFESAWGEPTTARHVVMPLAVRMGRLP